MARIRTIKPEFPQSESTGSISRDARLLFIQLWTIVDDEGRSRAASRMLAGLLYPYDDDARDLIDGWLDELERAECIRRYEVDGSSYLEIVNWLKHQKIDRPSKSRLPPCPADFEKPLETSRSLDADLGPRTVDQGPKDIRTVAVATRPPDDQFEQFKKAYPKRKGSNPWRPAEKLFDAAIKSGCDPGKIIAALRAGVGFDLDKIGTEYIPQAVKWLRDRRWEDHTEPPDIVDIPGFYAAFCSPQLDAWLAHGKATGKIYPRDKHGGWRFPSEWPPGHKQEAA